MRKEQDTEYRDVVIKKVDHYEDGGWGITADDGWSFYVPNKGVEPHVGEAARFYGAGIGSIVRGLDIAGHEVFYRTPAQQAEQNRIEGEQAAQRRREDFERNKAQLDADYAALPAAFRARVDGFRVRNPAFRVEFEQYEMMCCKEAVNIARAFPTDAEVKFFAKQDYAQQKAALPSLQDGHSGNSFGAACHLAWLYIARPELIEKEHGALCPLVGCSDYGCYSTVANAV